MSSTPPSIPERHVTTEGRSLRAALEAAAAELGVPVALVEHKIDLAHFRSAQGAGIGADTVRIFAWSKDPADFAPVLAAEEWMKALLAAMERTASVRADLRNGTVNIYVDAGEDGRHLVGRGGMTLKALQYLLEESVGARFPNAQFRIDVIRPPEESREDDRGERRDERPRGDDRGERPRGDDRGAGRGGERRDTRPPSGGDRGRDRGERRGPRRDDDRPRRSEADEEELKRLARKIAERVRETGEAEVIRRELNSYDRRIVHVEIAAIEGVGSRSVGEGHDRRIEIHAAADGGDEASQSE
ncbi:MAG: R3H domain-containing nucleic acid-binding protein [Pseudomonadota bacterium]|nr:R3H domain-containing nucleic acid-binding protein [Pseudomonadota bacterium]